MLLDASDYPVVGDRAVYPKPRPLKRKLALPPATLLTVPLPMQWHLYVKYRLYAEETLLTVPFAKFLL